MTVPSHRGVPGSVLVLAVLALIATALPAQAAYPADTNGSLAVFATKTGAIDLVQPNGSDRRALLFALSGFGGLQPSWSPDGRSIAYVADGAQLRIINVDGTDRRVYTAPESLSHPTWSPDGRQLAFARWDGSAANVYRIGSDGNNLSRVTSHRAGAADPVWSPDGDRIAFTRGTDIFTVDPITGSEQQLTNNCVYHADPAHPNDQTCETADPDTSLWYSHPEWHPSGDYLAMTVNEDSPSRRAWWIGRLDLRGLPKDTRPPVIVRRSTGHAHSAAFSPDGRQISFTAVTPQPSGPNQFDVFVTRLADGSRVGTVPDAETPTWQPCPTGTCPVFPVENDPDPDECDLRSRDVGVGGPHRVSVVLPSGSAVVTFFGVVAPGGVFEIGECSGRELGDGIFAAYELRAGFSFDRAEVCLPYDEDAARRAGLRESEIDLIHEGSGGLKVTTTRRDADANFVCGEVGSFSPFWLGAGAVGRGTELACPPGEVPPAGFVDVSSASTHFGAIECLAWWEITRGVDAGNTRYAPGASVSRGQMATFMARVIERSGGVLPEASRDWFDDDDGSVHEGAINRLREAGVVAGTGGRSFSPGRSVTRAQMATFLRNTFSHRTAVVWGSEMDYFSDDDGNVHEGAINAAAAVGVTRGTDGLTGYSPGKDVTRAQMATFITRMLDLLIDDGHTQPRS
jgi:hypothetical protein